MSNFSVKLDAERSYRYAFQARLWNSQHKGFGSEVPFLLDTGAFNTLIHEGLVRKYGVMLRKTLMTSVGGYRGEANLCILEKIQIGGYVLEKVLAIAIPFSGELKDHVLLGANVINNWKMTLSRKHNRLDVTEDFCDVAARLEYPYRYCYNNKGGIIAFQAAEDLEYDLGY